MVRGPMAKAFQDKVVLIIGAPSGIGRAAARRTANPARKPG
jgi:NAD(P)-dependent dehydrogenase (short-subunit alcohol dehydrogenase family)